LGGVLALAGYVRMTGLADGPPGFYADEASIGVNAYSLLSSGREENGSFLPLFFSAFGEQRPPVFVYSAVPFVGVLGLTETAVRLTAATYGTLTVAAVFLLASVLFNTRVGLLAAFLLAIAPWHIHYSRAGFELITFPFFFTLSLSLFILGLHRPRLLAAAVVGAVVTLYTYWAGWLLVPLTVGVVGFLYRRELARHGLLLKRMGVVAVLLSVPFIVNLITGGVGRLEHSSVLAVAAMGLWGLNGYTQDYNERYPATAAGFWGWQYGPAAIVDRSRCWRGSTTISSWTGSSTRPISSSISTRPTGARGAWWGASGSLTRAGANCSR
jgi:hypothetical protein